MLTRRPFTLLLLLAAAGATPGLPADAPSAAPLSERILAAPPAEASPPPAGARRLLIFDRNVGYPGHASITAANSALTKLGRSTGAYEAEVHRDPIVFAPASLARFDAVLLNNTVGNLFTNEDLRTSLAEFVAAGGGLIGIHGASVAFVHWPGGSEDWPEFAWMLGARGARHRAADEQLVLRLDEPEHPLVRAFPSPSINHADEFFRFSDPWSRDRCRVLISVDLAASALVPGNQDMPAFRPDSDYAIAWIRRHGRGRVFYCALGHQPHLFEDPVWLKFLLAGLRYALGDLTAPDQPSSRISPGRIAQSRLGWQIALAGDPPHSVSVRRLCRAAAGLALHGIALANKQPMKDDAAVCIEPAMTAAQRAAFRIELAAAGLRPLVLFAGAATNPPDAARLDELAARLGVETVMCERSGGDGLATETATERRPPRVIELRSPVLPGHRGRENAGIAWLLENTFADDGPDPLPPRTRLLWFPAERLALAGNSGTPPMDLSRVLRAATPRDGTLTVVVAGNIGTDGSPSPAVRSLVRWLDEIAITLASQPASSAR